MDSKTPKISQASISSQKFSWSFLETSKQRISAINGLNGFAAFKNFTSIGSKSDQCSWLFHEISKQRISTINGFTIFENFISIGSKSNQCSWFFHQESKQIKSIGRIERNSKNA